MPSPGLGDQEVSSTSSPDVTAAAADSVTDSAGDALPHSTGPGHQVSWAGADSALGSPDGGFAVALRWSPACGSSM